MKVLDLFCGRGGWSKPFIEDGDEVVGIDIVDVGYPAKLILKDVRQVDARDFTGYDLIIGSPPCNEASKANVKKPAIPKEGLELITQFNRIIFEASPRFWAMENVARMAKFYHVKPIWKFRMGSMAQRFLWGNIPIGLSDYRFPNRILATRTGRHYAKLKGTKALNGRAFAEIPYPIARFIADSVKQAIESIAPPTMESAILSAMEPSSSPTAEEEL